MIEKKKYLNWVAGAAGIIVLGAIGSGAWQMIGQPVVDFLIRAIINTIDIFFSSYKDSIYYQASLGFHERSANNTLIIIILLMSFFPLSSLIKKKDSSIKSEENEFPNFLRIFQIINLSILVSISIYLVTQLFYVNRVIVYVDVSLDRLAPYESQDRIIELRAKFREVKTASDYHSLYEEIEGLIKKNGLSSRSVPPL